MGSTKSNVNIIKYVKKLPWFLGEHAFVAVLMFVLLDLIIGAIIFYIYISSTQGVVSRNTTAPLKFERENFQRIVRIQDQNSDYLSSTSGQTGGSVSAQ